MSLVVWLPLNGDLTNQGLSNITVTNNGATVDNNGKIGKCYKFDGDVYLNLSKGIDTTKDYSICYWFKEFENNTLSQFRVVYQCGNLVVGQYGELLDIYNNAGSGFDVFTKINNTTIWHHACFTFQSSKNLVTIYIDGKYAISKTVTSIPTSDSYAIIGKRSSGTYLFQGNLNDFRIYDHALSAKEVGELAKGLVLHYRLAGPGQENLTKNTYDWKNYSVDGSGQSNIGSYSVKNGICHIIDSNSNTRFYYNQGEKVPINGTSTYTISIKYKWVSGTDKTFRWQLEGFNGNSKIATIWSSSLSTTVWHGKSGEWQLIECPFNFNNSSVNGLRIYIQDGADYTTYTHEYYLKEMKLEKGSIATPWCPNSTDALYAAIGYNNNIEYDCSGYRRNGTKSGTLTWNIDSPRYTTSYSTEGGTAYLTSPNMFTSSIHNFTLSIWGKTSNQGGRMIFSSGPTASNPALYHDSSSLSWCAGDGSRSYFENNGVTIQAGNYKDGKWHHYVVTGDGIENKLYIDGQYTGKSHIYHPLGYTYTLGKWIGDTSHNWDGLMSDFRIYVTTLSAEDIAELYHSAVIVDNTGKNYAYEYFEA